MYLCSTTGSKNIPEGGIRLSRTQALQFQKNIIKKWKSLYDIVFLEYGYIASSAFTFASSFYITNTARSLLNIGSRAKFVPHIVSTLIPTVYSGYWTEKTVTENTLLMTSKCPMCLHLQFGMGQILLSVFYPAIMGLVVHIPVAQYYNTIALPDISKNSRNAYSFGYKLLKTKALQYQIIAALQIPLIILLPYLQEKELDKINKILRNETSTKTTEIE